MRDNFSSADISTLLDRIQKPVRCIYVSSYVPRKCGIATFTKDLTTAVNNQNPEMLAEIVAISDQPYAYPWEVKYHIQQDDHNDYRSAVHYMNQSSTDIINLQHEFGLFGGKNGEYILPFIEKLKKPLVTCFHSILPKPNKHQQHIMEKIIAKSCAVIAMSSTGRKLLMDVYGCDAQKTVVVHHGVPDFTFNDQSVAKKKLQVYSRYMMLVSGLLGPGKGFEYAILALPHILQAGIDVRLYIVGQTHPTILQREDEHYRRYLQKLVQEQQVEKAVVWVDRFLHLDELMEYYRAADIYITPHLDPQQPTSGTLAKALGAGKVCISTPFVYAAEMLKNDHGILVPFRDAEAIARAVIMVLKDMTLYETYRKNAYILGKTMQWPRVAKRYLDLFRIIIHNNQK